MIKHSYYQYQVFLSRGERPDETTWAGWVYEIFSLDSTPQLVAESSEWYDSYAEARASAINHINKLENGEIEHE